MSKKLLNKTLNDYGDNYQSHLFEQYKMYVESIEKISDRRQNANNFFLTLNTVLISVIGLSFQLQVFDDISWSRLVFSFLGILICIIFWFLLRSYKQLNSGKFVVIHEIEQHLPLSIYDYEWDILGRGEDTSKYYPFSHIELLIPWVFGIIYILLGVAFIV
jgi:hypothetical protein